MTYISATNIQNTQTHREWLKWGRSGLHLLYSDSNLQVSLEGSFLWIMVKTYVKAQNVNKQSLLNQCHANHDKNRLFEMAFSDSYWYNFWKSNIVNTLARAVVGVWVGQPLPARALVGKGITLNSQLYHHHHPPPIHPPTLNSPCCCCCWWVLGWCFCFLLSVY